MRILGGLALSLFCVSALWLGTGCASGESSSGGGATGAIGGAPTGGIGGTGLTGGTGGAGGSGGTVTGGTGAAGGTGGGGTGGWPGECSGSAEKACYGGPPGTEGVGDCKAGKQVCQNGTFGACQEAVEPTTEVCDNRDNDCDGLTDEELGQTKCGQGICLVTVENCVAGLPQTCTPKQGNPTEACDGADDNCDGQVDEGCTCTDGKTQACYTGDPTTKGVGLCKAGSQTCSGGKWGTCTGEVLPVAEKCNGVDEDCDGQVDDGNPQSGQTCNTGKQGVCGTGTTACQNSTLVCLQTTQPSPEQCNNLDDNCNGAVDDGNPGSGTSCSTGKPGVCSSGTTQCQAGILNCVQNVQPSTEQCNGVDDNCNGTPDEGCNCLNGTTQGCYNGPSGTQNVGACKGGTQTCVSGNWGSCVGEVLPKTESCNNVDDNCNGTKDENNPGGGGSCNTGKLGICAAGTNQCQNGALVCVQNQQPAPTEVCSNTLDDNCNGTVNEGCTVVCAHDKCLTGVALSASCETCVSQVCAADSYCCNSSWDSICVSEVRTICKSLKCDEAKGSCAHSLCISGTALVNGCDSAKAGCVSKICAVDSYCCTNSWDGICVGEVSSVCANNCN